VDAREVAGGLLVGRRVDAAADRLESDLQLEVRGELAGAAKQHMLEKVRDPRLAGGIVAAAGLQVDGNLRAVQVRHVDRHQAQAVG